MSSSGDPVAPQAPGAVHRLVGTLQQLIATVPSTGWFVVARMPTAEVFQPIAAMRGFIWKGTLIFLLVMILDSSVDRLLTSISS